MATKTTRKSGENHEVTFGTTVLGTARRTSLQLQIRTADARGSGDAGPVEKELGLAGGQVQAEYLITDEATMALLGTYATLLIRDSGGTTVFSAECLCRGLQRRETHDDLTIVDAIFSVQGLPTVPDLSGLAFS
ncbi:MAG: hypothetical protein HZB16_17790 [Armatimonadetes bacterium]|nr:hypothetical protein [Armatimonadota bacterium]